jgi:hypothetical protein
MRAPAPAWRRAPLAALLLACLLGGAAAQTYTNENLPGVTAYSAWAGAPTASTYSPYVYSPPPTPTPGAAPGAGGCTGVGRTCLPVTVTGNAVAGYWLTRNSSSYWIKCARAARAAPGVHQPRARAARGAPPAGPITRPGSRGDAAAAAGAARGAGIDRRTLVACARRAPPATPLTRSRRAARAGAPSSRPCRS